MITCACTETSSAETGSSATISRGFSDQSARDAEPLALAAGELVRIAVASTSGRRPTRSNRSATRVSRARRRQNAEVLQRLGDDVAGAQTRIERRVGVLEDHLHLRGDAARMAARRSASRCPRRRSMTLPPVGSTEPQDQLANGRLAAAGLADEAERLAGAIEKVTPSTALHLCRPRAQQPALHRKVLRQVADGQDVASIGIAHDVRQPPAGFPSRRRSGRGRAPSSAEVPRRGSASVAKAQRGANAQPAIGLAQRRHDAGDLAEAAARATGRAQRGSEASRPRV